MFDKSTSISLVDASDAFAAELFSRKKYKEAIQQTEITLSLAEKHLPEAYKNLSACYSFMFEPQKALESYLKYLDLSKSDSIQDIRKLSDLYAQAGLLDQAFSTVLNKQQYSSEKFLDTGWHLFRQGKYEEAFYATDAGKKLGNILWIGRERYDNLPKCPRWNLENISGKRLCIVGECGLGDEFIFSRWLSRLPEDVDFCYYTNNTIADVIERNFPNCKRHSSNNVYDYWVPSMSLPLLLKDYEPNSTSYIKPNPIFIEKWKAIIKGKKTAVVSWTGSRDYSENYFRNIDIDYLVSKIKDDYMIYSVCKEAVSCPEGVIDLTSYIESWEDTLAILHLSSIAFCSCSSVAHAAGAIGKKAFVYTRPDDYFTWSSTESGAKSKWYDSVTVWRTDKIGKWKEVIDASVRSLA